MVVLNMLSSLRPEEAFLALLAVCAGLIAWWQASRSGRSHPKTASGVVTKPAKVLPGWPILGSTPEMLWNMGRLNDWLVDKIREHGNTFVINLFGRPPTLVTADPANIEYIQKTNFENYVKGSRFHLIFEELLGNGIFNVDGHEWYTQRKTASHMFSVSNFRNHMEKVFVHHSQKVVTMMERAASNNRVLDLQDLLYRYTLDSITEIAFGEGVNTLDSPEPVKFAISFDTATASLMRYRTPLPMWLWRLFRLLRTRPEQTIVAATKALDEVAYHIIDRRKKVLAIGDDGQSDLLSLFLKAGHDDDQYLRDMILNFVIAGRDTTANALNWTFHCLHLNPKVQEKAVAEIEEVLGDAEPGFDNIKGLKYLNAIFLETLRLYPSIAKNVRSAVRDDVLPDGTLIPGGGVVLYTPYAMGRDPNLWEDPLTFKPERWLGANGDLIQKSPFVFNAFNGGPRLCLGKPMAIMEAMTLLASVLRRFRIVPAVAGRPVKQVSTLTLPMEGGHPIHVRPRA